MEDWVLPTTLIYFVVIPMVLFTVWLDNNPLYLEEEDRTTFFQYIISKNEKLTYIGNILFILFKAGTLPSILIFQILKLLLVKQRDK